jgi:hypothetical protein
MSQIKVDQITDEAGTGAPDFPNGIEVGGQTLLMPANSALVTLSGSSVDFTGIPATARRVTLMINGLSTNGTVVPLVQLGNAGGIETTGYLGAMTITGGGQSVGANFSSGVSLAPSWVATVTIYGSISFELMDASTNLWVIVGSAGRTDAAQVHSWGGTKSLSETLTQIRITAGANTFDAGTASVSWE